MAENESVIYEVDGKVCIITLNEPDSLNALSPSLRKSFIASLEKAEADPEIHAIVLTGNGKAFSAGGDVRQMGKRTIIESVEKVSDTTKIVARLAEVKKPVIAAVNGYAMGAGFSMALACDIIIAEKKSKFGLSFAKIGLVPDCGLLHFLPKIVGPWKAKELIYNAEVLTAEEALDLNILNKVVDEDGSVLAEALKTAKKLADGPLQAMIFVKSILHQMENSDLKMTMQFENTAQAILQQTHDYLEGVSAFKEKRAPKFIGR